MNGLGAPAPGNFSLEKVGRSAVILTASTAVVQVIGFFRELYVAAQVGVSAELDALIIGIMLPVTLAGVFSAGIRVALVPSYLDARKRFGLRQARRVAGALLVAAVVAGSAVAVLLVVAAEPIAAVTGPGLDEAGREDAATFLRISAPSVLFSAVATVPFAICQAEQRFRAIGLAMVAGPLATIVIMLATWDTLGLGSVAVGTLVGNALSPALLLAATVRYGVAPVPTRPQAGLGLRSFLVHSLPLTASALILRLNAIFDRAIASVVVSGGVGVLRYADSVIRAPITAIAPAWSGAVYPAFVESAQRTDGSMLGSATDRTVRFTISAFTPISFLAAAVAPVAISVVYQRGAFGQDDVNAVAIVVAAFAPVIAILTTSSVVTSALNARRSGLILLSSSIINVIVNLTLDVLFAYLFGVAGIALASSFTVGITTLYKASQLARLEDGFALSTVARTFGLAAAASLPASLVIAWVSWSGRVPVGFVPGLISLFGLALAGLGAYVVVASVLGLKEPGLLASFGWRFVTRRVAG